MSSRRSVDCNEHYSQISEEPFDNLVASDLQERSPKGKNAWLHLKTITTFDSVDTGGSGAIDRTNSNAQHDSLSINHACNFKDVSNLEDAVSASKSKTCLGSVNPRVEMNDLFHTNQHLDQRKSWQSVTHSRNFEVCHEEVLRVPLQHRQRHRSHNNSSSQDGGPYGTVEEPVSHVSISSSLKKNGTVSDVGVDTTNASLGSCSPAPVQSVTRFSPTSLLVESLIEQLCRLMEKDSGKQKMLYHVICEKLHQMHLIDDTYNYEEFQFMRSHYQKALYQLLAVAKSSTQSSGTRNILLPLPSSNMNLDFKISSEQIFSSRYQHEYQEIEYIAKGGFGHVYKVRNRLDGGEYAIKKINLQYHKEGFLRSLKEVKMLARLNHPNIVSYKAAWLEPLDKEKQKTSMQSSSQSTTSQEASFPIIPILSNNNLPLPSVPNNILEDSLDIVFQESSPDNRSCSSGSPSSAKDNLKNKMNEMKLSSIGNSPTDALGVSSSPSNGSSPSCSSPPSSGAESYSSRTSAEGAVCPRSCNRPKRDSLSSPAKRNWATLYVQMQLCERTLRQWLDERNKALPAHPLAPDSVEGMLALNLFRKIVRGVEYIHAQGIVHHDIKPSNIFVNANLKEVQVGDFGLSCCILSRVDSSGVVGEHHGEVGTRVYAAPEQLCGKCTSKSDVYSLGIVFLELLQPFHTDMERSKVIQKLRDGQLTSDLTRTWPLAAKLISDLLATSPAARPSANDLLQRVDAFFRANLKNDLSSQLAVKDETIRLLQETVASRDQEIAELKRRLSLVKED